MHQHVHRWVAVGILIAAVCLRVEAQGTFQRGTIVAARVQGKVIKTVDGDVAEVVVETALPPSTKISTGPNSSVVLAFSNGAMIKMGENSELVIEEFLQEPFSGTVAVSKLNEEPSESKTKLRMDRGELIADVKKLKRKDDGFTVQAVAGLITTRGGVFRVLFRPISNTQASFQATTASGRVEYSSTSGATRTPIPEGQEIAFTIDLTPDGQGKTLVTLAPARPGTTSPSTPQVIDSSVEIAKAIRDKVPTK